MINRRQFIRNTAVTGAALASAKLLAKPAAQDKSLPPPIAALKSMKDQARPISKEERRQRIERARELMATNKLDAILMCGGTSLVYFSHIEWWLSERFFGWRCRRKAIRFMCVQDSSATALWSRLPKVRWIRTPMC